MPRVSVIISNRNDAAMLAVTVASCLEEFKALGSGGGEVVIVDNSDEKLYEHIAAGSFIPKKYFQEGVVRLYRQDFPCLFTARELAIRKANSPYVICLDSHMLCGYRMIRSLVDFMNSMKDKPVGFAHAPIRWLHQHESRARHDRAIEDNELGPWGTQYSEVRKITWKGMPWICRRNWFLKILRGYGALSQHRISWGGGDMHIGTKPWLLGFPNYAVPCSPGIHIGPFPKHVRTNHTYRLYSRSGEYPASFGFLVSCAVLGGKDMMERNRQLLTERFNLDVDSLWDKAVELAAGEREWLLRNQVMTYTDYLAKRPWEH